MTDTCNAVVRPCILMCHAGSEEILSIQMLKMSAPYDIFDANEGRQIEMKKSLSAMILVTTLSSMALMGEEWTQSISTGWR